MQFVWLTIGFQIFITFTFYRVHKSCSYRVFSLQEFNQNESRAGYSSSNYCTNFRKKQVKEKETKKKKVGVKPWPKRRKELGFYETLIAELRLEDEYNYKNYLRMTFLNFEEIFQLIKDDLNERPNPTQTTTCSHKWLFIKRGIIQKLFMSINFFYSTINSSTFTFFHALRFCIFLL